MLTAGADEPEEGDVDAENDTPVWMILTTKKHVTDTNRLKPKKIAIPHALNANPSATICLITSDPQRLYKDVIADRAFPRELSSRITRVVGLQKLKGKFKSYEARRQLAAEHDIFLADSRIATWLPGVLGKAFYKGTSKRPIPVEIAGPADVNSEGQRIKKVPGARKKSIPNQEGRGAAEPAAVAREIQKALNAAVVYLSPSATTSVKVGRAAFKPEQIALNVEAIVKGMTDKIIPQGWQNVRAIHLKGPNTASFPIWLASELWTADSDVLEHKKVMGKKASNPDRETSSPATVDAEATGSKRKADQTSKPNGSRHAKKKMKAELEEEEVVDKAAESLARKKALKQQRAAAMLEVS